jgi:hypothetical protein
VELVDTLALGASGATRGGSSPLIPTNKFFNQDHNDMAEISKYEELKSLIAELPANKDMVNAVIGNDYNNLVQILANEVKIKGSDYVVPPKDLFGKAIRHPATPKYYEISDIRSRGMRLLTYVNEELKKEEKVDLPSASTAVAAEVPQALTINHSEQDYATLLNYAIKEVTEQLTRQEPAFKAGSREREFIYNVKTGIGEVRSVLDIVNLIFSNGVSVGLDVKEIPKILKI